MADPLIIDVHTIFGPVPPRGVSEEGTGPLQKLLDTHGVAGAISLSSRGLYHSAAAGNREAVALCGQTGGAIRPAAILDPRQPNADQVVAGAWMLCLMPSTQGWPVRFAPLKAALKSLTERGVRVPLFWEAYRLGDATDAYDVLEAAGYAGDIVFGSVTHESIVEAVTVAKAGGERFHIATNGMRGVGAVAYAVEALGASQVVFGSGAPTKTLGGALGLVRIAGLSDDDLASVLGENAKRLLKNAGGAIQ